MSDPSSKPLAEQLATPAQFLPGVGPQRGEILAKLGLRTAADLLFYFPRDYEEIGPRRSIAELVADEAASVVGKVEDYDLRETGPGRCIFGILLRDGNHYLRAVWFNQPYLERQFTIGRRVLLQGKPKISGMRWEMVHPQAEFLDDEEDPPGGGIVPIYGLTEGLKQGTIRRIVKSVAERFAPLMGEAMSPHLMSERALLPIGEALLQIHNPSDRDTLAKAKRRFIFQELLVMQLALAMRREKMRSTGAAAPLEVTAKIDARIRRLFPYSLTKDQEQAVAEIVPDLASERPMNRLLQGDVGTGKTLVAVYAMLVAVAHGCQAALMAPTEILARQHLRTLTELLAGSQVRLGMLAGSMTSAERERTLAAITAGEINLVVGTQAILTERVEFAKLGLVVIDEQHKFGVKQRAQLKQAAVAPHYLVMTATPIPRTLTMTQYGDLDVTTLRNGPPGRQKVHSYLGNAARRTSWWKFFREELQKGRQGFVIAPLVEESETVDAASAAELFEELANGELAGFRLGLVHGRLSSEEKEHVMEQFRDEEVQVLVATTAVEVGVDVPNATVMTIEGAERFGLAQLHQLRGRVSRGSHPGYVCVFPAREGEEAEKRLQAFVENGDGFKLAELDFELRGPGDLFGTKQHGLPPLRIADLNRDSAVLTEARHVARDLITADPQLAAPEHALLLKQVVQRYGKALDLGDVG